MWKIQEFQTLPSTNTYARELLTQGEARHGDVYQAHHQTEGRGRFYTRVWEDEPLQSLLMSVVITEPVFKSPEIAQFFTALVLAAAVRDLLHPSAIPVRIKWPNDIYVSGKKLSGILAEAVWSGENLRGLVIGIGLNVNQRTFSPPLDERATSLYQIAYQQYEISVVRDTILTTFAQELEKLRASSSPKQDVIERLRQELMWMKDLHDLSVEASEKGDLAHLQYVTINAEGALIVRDGEEQFHTLRTAHLVIPPQVV